MKTTRRAFLGAAGTVATAALLGARLQEAKKALSPTEDNIEIIDLQKSAGTFDIVLAKA